MALFAMLAMGLGLMAWPAEAAPFAYVTNDAANTVSVIDTATNTVVAATLPVGIAPNGVAVTPDGKHAYVTNAIWPPTTVSVIDTATNTVVATVPVGTFPDGGRRHPGRETRLCRECWLQQRFGDRHGHQHGGGHGRGGD